MSKQLLVGLPATGKSTFLAALWHVVESGELPDSLCLERLEGDLEYLNSLRAEWLAYSELRRTPLGSAELTFMRLRDPRDGKVTDLYLPDMAGETFHAQWIQRRWDSGFVKTAAGAVGLLLFVHPDHIREPTTIADVARSLPPEPEEAAEEMSEVPSPWQAEDAPTQVQLVDLLQFIARELVQTQPLRLAVVVSAWDVVLEQFPTTNPDRWIDQRLPLLAQFLATNPEFFETQRYGVSAQGGDLRRDLADLVNVGIPAQRILVQHGARRSSDITAPIRWAMGGDAV